MSYYYYSDSMYNTMVQNIIYITTRQIIFRKCPFLALYASFFLKFNIFQVDALIPYHKKYFKNYFYFNCVFDFCTSILSVLNQVNRLILFFFYKPQVEMCYQCYNLVTDKLEKYGCYCTQQQKKIKVVISWNRIFIVVSW